MVICLVAAYSVIRSRRQNFQRFWYLHHLLLIVLVMMMVHGTGNLLQHYQTIYWVCGPLTLYLVPRFYRELQSKSLKVEGVQIHDGVLALDLEKPKSWVGYQMSGMYAFINIPSISRWEWHPFTLSSAPHQEHIGFHIRAAGDWTSKALELMESKVVESALPAGGKDRASIKIRVEGPIGASSQGFGDHEVVVLIGAGIGITVRSQRVLCGVSERKKDAPKSQL
jgi:predicted ferric reductase